MGIYPAIDIPQSVSRVMPDVTDPVHRAAALRLRQLVSTYFDNRDLVIMGGYSAGSDAMLDEALRLWPQIRAFVAQGQDEHSSLAECRSALLALVGEKVTG